MLRRTRRSVPDITLARVLSCRMIVDSLSHMPAHDLVPKIANSDLLAVRLVLFLAMRFVGNTSAYPLDQAGIDPHDIYRRPADSAQDCAQGCPSCPWWHRPGSSLPTVWHDLLTSCGTV